MVTSESKSMLRRVLRRPIPPALLPALAPARIALDVVVWVVAIPIAAQIRYSMVRTGFELLVVARAVLFCSVAQLALGLVTGLYRNRRRYGSFDEVALLLRVTMGAGIVGAGLESSWAPCARNGFRARQGAMAAVAGRSTDSLARKFECSAR